MNIRRLSVSSSDARFLRIPGAAIAVVLAAGAFLSASARAETPDLFEVASLTAHTTNEAEADYTAAGGRPYQFRNNFIFNLNGEEVRDATVTAPPGFLGNPVAFPRCPLEDLGDGFSIPATCPPGSQVGFIEYPAPSKFRPLFNVIPEHGYPAQFAFRQATNTVSVYPTLLSRTHSYRISLGVPNIPLGAQLSSLATIFYGVPSRRGSGTIEAPFLSNPLDCSEADPTFDIAADSWLHSGARLADGRPDLSDPHWKTASTVAPAVTGCNDPSLTSQWHPSLETKPLQGGGPVQADQPSGLAVDLDFPQSNDPTNLSTTFEPERPQAPEPKNLTVKLPAGLSINPASADGLGACSDLASDPAGDQVHYDNVQPVTCPDSSKIGTVVATSPLLATHDPISGAVNGPEPIDGDVYLLKPHPGDLPITGNQDGRFRLLIQLENADAGVNIKLPGVAVADKQTGQLTATFSENPQLPSTTLEVNLKSGPRAPLATPVTCGSFQTTSDVVPWSTPGTPDATPTASFSVGSGPNGTPCPASPGARPFAPTLTAGSESSKAGAASPFTLHIARADGEQELSSLNVTMPPGFAAKLTGVPYCPEASITAAASKSGAAEQASPSCPAASQIGSVSVGAGPGTDPYYVTGKAYLAGPYKGAPLSAVFITPAVAGPFDLGDVVVRAALQINPETAQVTVNSDPLPTILDGVPLRLRSITARIDRPNFTLNPTNCSPLKVSATVSSSNGAMANPSNPFQVGGCKALGFKPSLSLALKGGTKRSDNPALTATLTYPKGNYANIAQTTVLLPSSEFIDNANINNPCTRVQFAANACPPSSILGTAVAYTPLLEKPLEGPVYFRSNGGERELPDMVADLNGQIHVTLVGFIDAVHKKGSEESRVRTRFLSVPDAPVSKFVLSLKGGKKGLIENSKNLCAKGIGKASVQLAAQNGLTHNFETALKTSCPKKKKKAKHSAHHSAARQALVAPPIW